MLETEEVSYAGVVKNVGVEDVVGATAFKGVGDLGDAAAVEAFNGCGGDAAVVIGADDTRVVLVNGTTVVHGVIDDVVVEFVLANGTVDVRVIDEVAS